MSDYLIDAKIRNANIRRAMKEAGFSTVAEMCRAANLSQQIVGEIINLRKSPTTKEGQWRKTVYRLCDILHCFPDDLFSESQKRLEIENNGVAVEVTEEQAKQIACQTFHEKQLLSYDENLNDPESLIETEDLKHVVSKVLGELKPREAKIIRSRFGIDTEELTRREVAQQYDLCTQRIYQIEKKAMEKLYKSDIRTQR